MTNNLFSIEYYDGIISKTMQTAVDEYLQKQTWHIHWFPFPEVPHKLNRFRPSEDPLGAFNTWPIVQSSSFARCCLATNEQNLKKNHKLIHQLWKDINRGLDNQYEITGYPEDMFDEEYSAKNGEDGWGWRVYTNGQYSGISQGSWGPHRDTPNLDDETSVTILYIVNKEWYPRWSGEFIFYPEDPNKTTGDYQQFNIGEHQQKRGFNVGWPDQGKIISPVPNRVIVYDGRALHNCHAPSSGRNSKPLIRVVFRARRRKKNVR